METNAMTDRTMRTKAISFTVGLGILAAAMGTPLFGGRGEAFADPMRQAPNSRVAMEVPEKLEPIDSDGLFGFMDRYDGVAFYIEERPGAAYDELKALEDKPKALMEKGVVSVETKKEELPGRKGHYIYLTGVLKTPIDDVNHYILIIRENDVTAIITANAPQYAIDFKTVTLEQIERAFITATVKAGASIGGTKQGR